MAGSTGDWVDALLFLYFCSSRFWFHCPSMGSSIGWCPLRALCPPETPPCPSSGDSLLCPAWEAFCSWNQKLKIKIWCGPMFVSWHSSKARSGAISGFSWYWGGHHQGKHISKELPWKLPDRLLHFGHLLPTKRNEKWAFRNIWKPWSKPANFWQRLKKADVTSRKVCSSVKNIGLDFYQV